MKVIFLDIDGVINVWRGLQKDASGSFEQQPLENLKLILEAVPEAQIVITSTWRLFHTLTELKAFFEEAGIAPERVLDVTPDLRRDEGWIRHYPDRGEEIEAWCQAKGQVAKMAIIDDIDLEQMEGLEENFFQTEFEQGLTKEQSLNIINHLKS
jgi:hypothetical protein